MSPHPRTTGHNTPSDNVTPVMIVIQQCCYPPDTNLQFWLLGQMHQINYHLQNCTQLVTWFKLSPRCIMVFVSLLVSELWHLYKWDSGGLKSQLYENLCSKLRSLDTSDTNALDTLRTTPQRYLHPMMVNSWYYWIFLVLCFFNIFSRLMGEGEFNLIDMSAV